jgi:hypothetical protein
LCRRAAGRDCLIEPRLLCWRGGRTRPACRARRRDDAGLAVVVLLAVLRRRPLIRPFTVAIGIEEQQGVDQRVVAAAIGGAVAALFAVAARCWPAEPRAPRRPFGELAAARVADRNARLVGAVLRIKRAGIFAKSTCP